MNYTKDWKQLKWGDICTIEYGKGLKGYKNNAEGIPVYGTNGHIGYTNKPLVKSAGVIIGRKGAYRGVHFSKEPFYVIDTAFYLKPKINNLDLKWAYYELLTKDINSMDSGSAIPSTSRDDFYALQVELPSLEEQKSISRILSTLDENIELNNKINKKLEEMSQAIFRNWFVEFEFPDKHGKPYKSSGGEMVESELGLIPKDWKIGVIGDYAKVKSGFAFKSAWWKNEGVPVIKIKNLQNKTINFSDVGYVEEDKIEKAQDFTVSGGDLLIAMTGATIGKLGMVPEYSGTILVNQRVGKFFLGNNPLEKVGFLYCLLTKNEVIEEIISRGGGSAQPNISPSQIESIKVVMPPDEKINEINRMLKGQFQKTIQNIKQNMILSQIRDNLLPKLISGEIRVPVEE